MKKQPVDIRTEHVYLRTTEVLPDDYHCDCEFCRKFLGVLIRPDGTKYNKFDRNKYYDEKSGLEKGGHIAKTPLHVARWAIQALSDPGDLVLDPTMGAGTTAVEALNHGRNVAGVEIEFVDVIMQNITAQKAEGLMTRIEEGDARDIRKLLVGLPPVDLIVNNPPYSGDKREKKFQRDLADRKDMAEKYAAYDTSKNNLAFLKENGEYYKAIAGIYQDCLDMAKPGAHLVIGVKDMVRNYKTYPLHQFLCQAVMEFCTGIEYIGMVLLPHYPTTMFMNTYKKRFPDLDIKVPAYQTINIFRKVG